MKVRKKIPGKPVQSKAFFDTIFILAAICLLFVFLKKYEIFEKFVIFLERFQVKQLEQALIFLVFFCILLIIFCYRRCWETRKKAKELQATLVMLRDTKTILEKVFASLSDAVFLIDAKTRNILFCNEGAKIIFGYATAELVGSNTSLLHVNTGSYETFGRLSFLALEKQGYFEMEFQMRRKDGQIFHTEHRVTAIYDDKGIRTGLVSVVRDIDVRKKLETDLQQHSERLEILREMDKEILTSSSPEEIAKVVLTYFFRLIPGIRASIVVFDPIHMSGKILAVEPPKGTRLGPHVEVPLSIFGDHLALSQGHVQIIEVSRLPQSEPAVRVLQDEGIRSYLVLPVISRGTLVGAINLGRGEPGAFDQDQLKVGQTVAEALAIGVQNALFLESLEDQQTKLRTLGERLADLEESGQKRLASELHDRVGSILAALGINLGIIQQELESNVTESIRARIADSQMLLEEMAEAIREIVAGLRPKVLDEYGLDAAIRWYCARFLHRSGILVDVHSEEIIPRPPASVETAFFRIAQEALTNVVKHSRSDTINITLEKGNEQVRLRITDHGVGFDLTALEQNNANAGWGLTNMQERARAVGGKLLITSAPGKGTCIEVKWEF